MHYVEIAVNVPQVSGVFHYHLPPELEETIRPGQLVVVPFGAQRVHGVVLRFIDSPEVQETKAVIALVDEDTVLTSQQLELMGVIAESTLAPLAAGLSLMLPAGVLQQADTLFSLNETQEEDQNGIAGRLLTLLAKRGALRGRQIDRALPKVNWRNTARKLVREGILSARPILPEPRVRSKLIRTAQLGVPPELARAEIEGLGRTDETRSRRRKMLDFLVDEPGPVDVTWVYAQSGGNLTDLRVLDELGLVMLREEEAWRDPLAGLAYDPSAPPELTPDQQKVWAQVEAGLQNSASKPLLLHGVTGSGKTEIYLGAVAETVKRGKQAVVLVPEIALTPQTVRRFIARFPGRVGLLHSELSEGERYDTWRRARAGRLSVIVGPRSALFAPLPDIGLVVVDEAHDSSYYQDTGQPYYHARDVAVEYARLCGAACILGTATPDVETYYHAQQGRYTLLELPARILAHVETINSYREKQGLAVHTSPGGGQAEALELPSVKVVDMREELKNGNRSIFSAALQESLAETLANRQQAILFLNQRGSASYIFCRTCGHSLRCPNCETALTLHSAQQDVLRCHHCGYQRRMVSECPNCGSDQIRHYGMGTQRVEEEIRELFPEAQTLRWDHETTRQKGQHDVILSHFSNHNADILIGTQMLAKGLDLPLVTLVGVVLADVGLHLPDFRAGERVFQVLSQVAGRAGRSPLGGRVVLQTFEPEHYVIQHAAGHDYAGFLKRELEYRRQLGYPPYAQLVRLEYRNLKPAVAQAEATRMAGYLGAMIRREERRATELIGPAPCYYTRLNREYRWQILLRGPQPASMLAAAELGDWRVEVNPQSVL